MRNDAYFENSILTAAPADLIGLLYKAALDAISAARRHLAAGDVCARSTAINRAVAITCELARILDHRHGAAVSRNLAELYDYIQRRLIEANIKQADEPLREAFDLFSTIAEAWQAVQRTVAKPSSEEAEGAGPEPDEALAGRELASRFRHELNITSTGVGWAV